MTWTKFNSLKFSAGCRAALQIVSRSVGKRGEIKLMHLKLSAVRIYHHGFRNEAILKKNKKKKNM